jgi:hypothetical protein
VKNYLRMVVVKVVQKPAENVLRHVQACKLKMVRWTLIIQPTFFKQFKTDNRVTAKLKNGLQRY